MADIIFVDFRPITLSLVNDSIKLHGVKTVEAHLVAHGNHPSFIKCLIRKILRMRGGTK